MAIRYRRSSLKTLLGITTEKKRIKRELGITALLRPFRWWGNEKRDVKRELGYYSPEAKLVRHLPPHSLSKIVLGALLVLLIPFALGWLLSSARQEAPPANAAVTPASGPAAPAAPTTAERAHEGLR
jgi:hypothetical protein